MDFSLGKVLALVGNLDDAAGEQTPSKRFRQFLKENVSEVGQIRDYIEECLRTSGDQYCRALQDLINHLGTFLGFEVVYGRYQGVQGQIGFDGYWKSPSGHHLVVETKTTEVYAINTATLLNYINELVAQGTISDPEKALGLYVVGRPNPKIRHLEDAIVANKRTQHLRIISANSLLSLAEMMNEYEVAHDDVLSLIRPSTPTIDPVLEIMARLVAGSKGKPQPGPTTLVPDAAITITETGEVVYWLTPVKATKDETAEECIRRLVGEEHIYAFGKNTPGRKRIKPGDWICFYATTKGVVAHAKVASCPEEKPHKGVRFPEQFSFVFQVSDTTLYLEKPTVIDRELRNSRLEEFKGRDPSKAWAWYVQATRQITKHDFEVLTTRLE